tara:strand:- start:46 stop:429 length:384 start_codon:yes stop_codon:yes gene_type:complete
MNIPKKCEDLYELVAFGEATYSTKHPVLIALARITNPFLFVRELLASGVAADAGYTQARPQCMGRISILTSDDEIPCSFAELVATAPDISHVAADRFHEDKIHEVEVECVIRSVDRKHSAEYKELST